MKPMLQPYFIRLRDAPFYLGMDKNRFNTEVRPFLPDVPIGKHGIAFDRSDLDTWAVQYKAEHARPIRRSNAHNTGGCLEAKPISDAVFEKVLAGALVKK
jgi:hypothetical protein